MASKYIGIPAAATAVAGAVVTLYRWRSFGLIPKLLVKAPAGTVPNDQPGNLRTLTMVAALWVIDKVRPRCAPQWFASRWARALTWRRARHLGRWWRAPWRASE